MDVDLTPSNTSFGFRICPHCTLINLSPNGNCTSCDFSLPNYWWYAPPRVNSPPPQTFSQWPYLDLFTDLMHENRQNRARVDVGTIIDEDPSLNDVFESLAHTLFEAVHTPGGTPAPHNFTDTCEIVVLSEVGTCVVCLDDLTAGRKLVCGHVFHETCVQPWFHTHNTCPTCRYVVAKE